MDPFIISESYKNLIIFFFKLYLWLWIGRHPHTSKQWPQISSPAIIHGVDLHTPALFMAILSQHLVDATWIVSPSHSNLSRWNWSLQFSPLRDWRKMCWQQPSSNSEEAEDTSGKHSTEKDSEEFHFFVAYHHLVALRCWFSSTKSRRRGWRSVLCNCAKREGHRGQESVYQLGGTLRMKERPTKGGNQGWDVVYRGGRWGMTQWV